MFAVPAAEPHPRLTAKIASCEPSRPVVQATSTEFPGRVGGERIRHTRAGLESPPVDEEIFARSSNAVTIFVQTSELADSVLLSSLGREGLEEMFLPAQRVHYPSGQTIFLQGDIGDSIILIESGRVEVSITSLSGRKSIIAYMGAGEVLGEIAALDGGGRSANVMAANNTIGLVLPREKVLGFIAQRPQVAQAIIAELCKKVRNASDMFANRSIVEGGPRLAKALLHLFDHWGKESDGCLVLSQPFSQTEIGDYGGLARENVNRYIKAWVALGILAHRDGALVLLDRPRLEELADI